MASFDDAHAALLGNTRLQFDLPATPQVAPPPRMDWHPHFETGGTGVVWALAIAGALVIAVLAVRALRDRRPADAASDAGEPPLVPRALAEVALADADRHAAAGRYLEAAHVLLRCGVAAINRRHPHVLRPTDTSREIARLPGLAQSLRDAFAAIAAAVELGLFGGRPVGDADYARCRRVFVDSALAERP